MISVGRGDASPSTGLLESLMEVLDVINTGHMNKWRSNKHHLLFGGQGGEPICCSSTHTHIT